MNFFSVRGYSSIANIQNLLEYDTTKLEDILDEGDVISESHTENHLLVDFFCRSDNLRKILFYSVGFNPDTGLFVSLSNDNRIAKYAFICCELLCSEIDRLLKTYLTGRGKPFLAEYMNFLQNTLAADSTKISSDNGNASNEFTEKDVDSTESNKNKDSPSSTVNSHNSLPKYSLNGHLEKLYFFRIINAFLQFSPYLMYQFIKEECPQFFHFLLEHLTSSSLVDLITKFIGNDSFDSIENTLFIDLMVENNFFQILFERFVNANISLEEALSCRQILTAISSNIKRSSIFVNILTFSNNLQLLFDCICGQRIIERSIDSSSIVLNFPFAERELLIVYVDFFKDAISHLLQSECFISLINSLIPEYLTNCIRCIISNEIFKDFIKRENEVFYNSNDSFPTNHSIPLGLIRLKHCEFISLVISLVPFSLPVAKAIIEQRAFPLLIDLFFAFKRNNFLHSLFVSAIASLIESELSSPTNTENTTPASLVLVHLLTETTFIPLIVKAFRFNAATKLLPLGGSPDCTVSYMGHLTQICDYLCKYSTEHSCQPKQIIDRLNEDDWESFLVTFYANTKTQEISLLGAPPQPQPESSSTDYNIIENENLLSFSKQELADFQYISIQEEQLGRLIVTRISEKIIFTDSEINLFSSESESDDEDITSDSVKLSSSFGVIFNHGPPSTDSF